MQVHSPGSDLIVDHFDAIANYIRQQQTELIQNLEYISSGSRSRLTKYERAISGELDHLFYAAHAWADTGLVDAYTSGWRGVFKDQPFTIPVQGLERIDAIRAEYRQRLNEMERYVRRDTQRFTKQMRRMPADEIAKKAKGNLEQTLGIKTVEQDVHIGGKVVQRHYRLDDYGKMQTRNATQRSYSAGVLDASETQKVKFVEVDDGPQCGWTSHNDPDRANGRIVSIDEARGNILSHPNCVRTFIPRPDLKGKPKDEHKGLSSKEKQAVLVASVLAAGVGARALFQVTTEVIDPEAVLRNSQIARVGTVYQKVFNSLVDTLHPIGNARRDAEILPLPFYTEPPPGPIELPLVASGEGGVLPSAAEARAVAMAGSPNLADYKLAVQDWGTAFMDHRFSLPDAPDWVLKAIKATNSDSEDLVKKKFLLFSEWVHSGKVKEVTVEKGLAPVLNFQLKRKQWNEFVIFRNLANEDLRSAVSATWTKYGPRTRVDLTDFLRGKITFTKDGLRRSVTFNPRGNYRTLLALSQDGTLMGALRYVPNTIFRAIIETDEFGKITGNVRLVPKSYPFRVKLTFGTPRPKFTTRETFAPGFTLADLRPKLLSLDLEEAAKEKWISPSILKELRDSYPDIIDASQLSDSALALLRKEHPGAEFVWVRKAEAGADFVDTRLLNLKDFSFGEIYGQLNQMELKDIIFEIDILKQTPFKISQEIKVPISKIRESLKALAGEGLVREDSVGWTGIFRWRPSEDAIAELQKMVAASKAKVTGTIKFSSLNTAFSSVLPDIRAAAYFSDQKFQEVLTSIKVSGLTVFRNIPNLEIFSSILQLPETMWEEFIKVSDEVSSRILLFMRRNGISEPWDIGPYFQKRLALLESAMGEKINQVELYRGVLEAIRGQSDNNILQLASAANRRKKDLVLGGPTHRKWLRILANISEGDSPAIIELKLQDMVWMMRSLNLDSASISDTLEMIDGKTVHLAASQLARGS